MRHVVKDIEEDFIRKDLASLTAHHLALRARWITLGYKLPELVVLIALWFLKVMLKRLRFYFASRKAVHMSVNQHEVLLHQ